MESEEQILEYELIDICIDCGYEQGEESVGWCVCEETPDGKSVPDIVCDADGIPMGNAKQDIKAREKIIKDFYAKWIAEHPGKAVSNKFLRCNIYVKYLSINETYNKAARSYYSTRAVFRLTEILKNAKVVGEVPPKNNKNQKQFDRILIMKYENIKLLVGVQRTTKEHLQYSITVAKTD